MIDTAFIMAFIGAAIAMIIGILVYSEISESVGGTFVAIEVPDDIIAVSVNEGGYRVQLEFLFDTYELAVLTGLPVGAEIKTAKMKSSNFGSDNVDTHVGFYTSGGGKIVLSDTVKWFKDGAIMTYTPASTLVVPTDGIIKIMFQADSSFPNPIGVSGTFWKDGGLDQEWPSMPGTFTRITDRQLGKAQVELSLSVPSPPINTGFETFTKADGIAMTVLGIIPVTLFFGLFTLFSSRTQS